MYIAWAAATILAYFFDFLFSASIPSAGVYAGFLLILFLSAESRNRSALFAACLYGFLLDLSSPIAPFGTMLAAHAFIWLILIGVKSIIINPTGKSMMVLVFLGSFAYALVVSFFQYAAINVFTEFTVGFNDFASIKMFLLSSFLTTCLLAAAAFLARFAKAAFGKWFFIK